MNDSIAKAILTEDATTDAIMEVLRSRSDTVSEYVLAAIAEMEQRITEDVPVVVHTVFDAVNAYDKHQKPDCKDLCLTPALQTYVRKYGRAGIIYAYYTMLGLKEETLTKLFKLYPDARKTFNDLAGRESMEYIFWVPNQPEPDKPPVVQLEKPAAPSRPEPRTKPARDAVEADIADKSRPSKRVQGTFTDARPQPEPEPRPQPQLPLPSPPASAPSSPPPSTTEQRQRPIEDSDKESSAKRLAVASAPAQPQYQHSPQPAA